MSKSAVAKIAKWRKDPVSFVRDNFKCEPDPWQIDALEAVAKNQRVAMKSSKGPGKLQPKDLVIDTPSGKKRFGDLKVGDYVFAEDGSPTKVTGVFDNGFVKQYKVIFNDGSFTFCGGEHLWKVKELGKNGWQVIDTNEIIKRGLISKNRSCPSKKFKIPTQGKANFNRKGSGAKLPNGKRLQNGLRIHPYLLGAWIGDGSKNSSKASFMDTEMDSYIQSIGYQTRRSEMGRVITIKGLYAELKKLNISHLGSHERYIPEIYKTASIKQRKELLCGLMDTDGCIDKNDGSMEFDTTSKRLAEDVIWIVRSLGGMARYQKSKKPFYYKDGKKIYGKLCYRVRVTLDFCPFKITRKIQRWKPVHERYLSRYIDKIEESTIKDSACIQVDHPSRCYLTNDFIVTHNTALLTWIAWWFLATRPHPKIAATSITKDNLSDNLWPEMAKWMKKSEFLNTTFEWTKTRIFCKDHPETWWMSARTWPKSADSTQQADTLAGLHADYLMFLIDEVGGIPDAVMAAAEAGLASGIESKIVMAGNPTHLEGPLYRACTSERHLWHVIEITSDPEDPKRSPRVSIQWAKEQIDKYGRDNPWVLVNVFGKFPPSSINTLIGPDQVRAAMQRHYQEDVYKWAQKRLGIDVARFGDDRCFDDKTEVLTNKGWMLFQDLSGDEMVLSVKDHLASWEKIDYIHEADWDGEMNLHEKRHLNFCITNNHRMIVRKSTRSKKYTIKPYRDLPKEFIVREENGWSGKNDKFKKFNMKKSMPNGGCQKIEYCFSYLDWAEFVGWFVSEGNVYKEKRDNGRLRIIISQYRGDKRNKLEALMNRMRINWRACSNGTQVEFTNREIGNWLINNCGVKAKNKFIPYEIKNASEEVINRFLKGFLLGDGSVRKNGLGKQYYTSSKKLADDLQEILVKVGRCGSLKLKEIAGSKFFIGDREVVRKNDTYIVYEKRGNTGKWCKKTNVKKIHYKGKVWCVATKYESFVVRRNGIPMWSGNTCLFPRQGLVAFRPVTMRHERNSAVSVDIANRVMRAKQSWGSEFEAIDDTGGWGKGAVDVLRAAGHDIHAVQFHTKALDPHYKNIRSEMWDTMCRWIIAGGCLPNIPELVNELCAPTYTYVNGQMLLEPKAQIKDRIGSSPDLGDALALTFSIPDMSSRDSIEARFGQRGKMASEYDPYSEERMNS